eukprot:CAMPEP_0115723678 /NCGR_PEP_ID=MMETSP0272-20121206/80365_1 /TAXON_ID=71861 /ORGANISM="Scrippsiella trochoidea, Strain CCMP3099" /LENGTH=49 /DNA_ID= /DNA_START= /DNA_END= /DNA_ORIENTATION=
MELITTAAEVLDLQAVSTDEAPPKEVVPTPCKFWNKTTSATGASNAKAS